MIAAHLDKLRSQSAPFSSISGQDSTDCLKGLQYLQKQNLHTKGLLLDLLVWVVCLEFPTGHAQILAVYPQSVLYHPFAFDYALVPVLGAFFVPVVGVGLPRLHMVIFAFFSDHNWLLGHS